MARRPTSTESTTFPTDYFKVLGDLMIEHILYGEKLKDIYVECEVNDVEDDHENS